MSELQPKTKPKLSQEEKVERARTNYENAVIALAVTKVGKTPLAKKLNQAINSGLNRREKSKLSTDQLNQSLLKVVSEPSFDNIKTAISKLSEKCPEPED